MTLAVAKMFLNFFLPSKSWKNHPQKLLRIPQIHFFSLTASTAQTEEIMFQNVAYWPTVYRTGIWPLEVQPLCISYVVPIVQLVIYFFSFYSTGTAGSPGIY